MTCQSPVLTRLAIHPENVRYTQQIRKWVRTCANCEARHARARVGQPFSRGVSQTENRWAQDKELMSKVSNCTAQQRTNAKKKVARPEVQLRWIDCSQQMSERKVSDDESWCSDQSGQQAMIRKEADEEIARAETRCVLYLRFITFGFLAVATIAVAATIYCLLVGAERAQLHAKFHDNAGKVMEGFGTILEHILMDVDAFAVSITSHATALQEVTGSDRSWPFVTFPNMAVRGSKLRALSKIFLFSLYHYVKHEDRDAWENYTRSHDDWVNQGIETQKTDPTFRGNIVEDWSSLGEINFYGSRAEDAEFYIARWQSSPIVVSISTLSLGDHVCISDSSSCRTSHDGTRIIGMLTKSR